MIQHERLSFFRVSFIIAGHTKFSPNLLFSRISQTYNKSDVFNTEELKDIIALYADVVIDDGSIVCDWRNAMSKYSKLPGIRSLHDFIYMKHSATNYVVAKVRKNCATGSFENSTIHVNKDHDWNTLSQIQILIITTFWERQEISVHPNLSISNKCQKNLFLLAVIFLLLLLDHNFSHLEQN